jgi:hypothetical protein
MLAIPTQAQLFYQAGRNIARGNEAFLDLVREGLTRKELERNIERRPELWGRFTGFLATLP